jgi:hypothetical protein
MADVGREIRALFDEVVDPIDIGGIVAPERRRGWRGWQMALAAGFAALVIVGGVVLLGSVDSAPVTGPSETSPTEEPPYLGLDLEGWKVTAAGEGTGGCAPRGVIGVFRQVSYEPVLPMDSGPIHVNVHVLPAAIFCTDPMPLDAADLGPPAGPPVVNDHGFIQVMGNRARVFDTEGTFHVQWMIGTTGVGTLQIFGNGLTLEDAVAIAGGVVELGSEQWRMTLALFPDGGTTTTIAPLDAVDDFDLPGGPLSSAVLEAVAQIPELAALTVEQAADHASTGDEPGEWGGVSLLAQDGSRIEIITQAVPADFDPLLAIGPDTQEMGPDGEDVFVRERDAVVQVVVIDQNGAMINLIIDRFAPSQPGTPGALSEITLDQARDWALLLIDLITD